MVFSKVKKAENRGLNSPSETKRIVQNDSASNSFSSGIAALGEGPRLKLRTLLLLNVASVFLAVIFVLPLWGMKLEHAIFDAFFQVRGPLSQQPDIVLVGIDKILIV